MYKLLRRGTTFPKRLFVRPAKSVHSHRNPPWDALDPFLLSIECPAKTLIRPCVCVGGGGTLYKHGKGCADKRDLGLGRGCVSL